MIAYDAFVPENNMAHKARPTSILDVFGSHPDFVFMK